MPLWLVVGEAIPSGSSPSPASPGIFWCWSPRNPQVLGWEATLAAEGTTGAFVSPVEGKQLEVSLASVFPILHCGVLICDLLERILLMWEMGLCSSICKKAIEEHPRSFPECSVLGGRRFAALFAPGHTITAQARV